MTEAAIPLFSYGTLQLAEVQRATYGRLLDGRPDALPGYRIEPLGVRHAEAVRRSGVELHMIASATGDPADRITGIVFLLTAAELAATDEYEGEDYARIEVVLESGARAFVYVEPLA